MPEHPEGSGPAPRAANMRFPLRSALLCFGIVLAVYLISFYGIERSRQKQGPWEVTFLTGTGNTPPQSVPTLLIRQPGLHLEEVSVLFPGEISPTQSTQGVTIQFDQPGRKVPFGTNVFEDLTFLPGVVAFEWFGHEIQLAPRTLVLNRYEHSWTNHARFELFPTNKLPDSLRVRRKRMG